MEARSKLNEKGRLVIPAPMRKALGIDVGDALDLRIEDGELRVSTMRGRLRRAQERIQKYIPEGVSLSEELRAERREAAKHE